MGSGGFKIMRFESGCKKMSFVHRFGSQNGPPNGSFSRLELSFGAFFPHLFLGPVLSSIVDDLGVDFGSLLSSFFIMFRVRARICKTLIFASGLQ